MEERKWISDALMWMSYSQAEETWVHNPPEYPDWTLPPNHDIPAVVFIRIWQSSDSINDVKKLLFWRTIEQLESQRQRINVFLSEHHFQPLQSLSVVSTAMLSPEQLESLESDGLIASLVYSEANPPSEPESGLPEPDNHDDYDAARAAFDAVSGDGYNPHSHIASVEIHGGRFRGRH